MTQVIPNIRSLVLYLSLAAGIFSLAGCDNRDYLVQKSFEKVCWSSVDALDFSLDLSTDSSLPLYLELSSEYAYQNLYLKLTHTTPSGTSQDIIFNEILSDKLGNWKQEMSGGTVVFELAKAFQIEVKEAGTHQFSLIQYMREDNLCGIEKIGILRP